jgi:hypothetical protein
MLMPLQVPPCVRVTVPICVAPTNILSSSEVAEAAGSVDKAAAMTNGKIERLKLLLRMNASSSTAYDCTQAVLARKLPTAAEELKVIKPFTASNLRNNIHSYRS